MSSKTIILSLGGSLIVPKAIDTAFLKQFRALLLPLTKRGYRFIVVTGGGDTARQHQLAARLVAPRATHEDLDWIGIAATKLNAELVRTSFGATAHDQVVVDPTKKVATTKKIIIGCGWKPGCSSDKDAVLLAKTFGAQLVINLSNIPYVYTADPRKHPAAKPIKQMTWKELLRLTGSTWKPGAHVPFDPEASKLAHRLGLTVVVCDGRKLENLRKIILGNGGVGTVIE